MSGGLKGPLSPPQELEVGGRRPLYLLVQLYKGTNKKNILMDLVHMDIKINLSPHN